MKKILLFLVCLVLFVSCGKIGKEENMFGGCTYDGIYFETETGMIDAHEYKLNVSGTGGEYDFKLLGVVPFMDENCSSGFVRAAITESSDSPDKNKYYKAKLHLTVPENMTDQDRSWELRIYSLICSHCAIITVAQEKGF